MIMRVPIEGHPHLERDMESNALINTDVDAYNLWLQRVKIKEQEQSRINRIENELSEIKNMLTQILDGKRT